MKSVSSFQTLSVLLIVGYQRLRPYFDQITVSSFGYVSQCKHKPSCSTYTIQQIRRHGTIAGVRKGFIRILSCH